MKLMLRLVGVFIVLVAVVGMFFAPAAWLKKPKASAPVVTIEIPEGAVLRDVSELLARNGVISSARGYRWYARLDASASRPKAGAYRLPQGMSYRQAARTLSIGPEREEISVRVIEGWTIRDIRSALQNAEVDVQASDFFAERFAADYPFLRGLSSTATLEGYLFPDTYRVWRDQLPDALFHKQLTEFAEVTKGFEAEAQKQGRTFRDVVILASIVEKEIRHAEDAPIVAGIFMNRLRDGMLLQSDATLNYVIQSGRTRLTNEELKNESPYNTYRHKGLPPGPISNPGKAALEAALRPAQTPYRFFLTDAEGKTYYARTLEEHIQNRWKAFGE